MANKQLRWQLPFLVVLIVGTVLILRKQAPYQTDQGIVFGTIYKSTCQSEDRHINENTDLTADSLFTEVFLLAKQISQETHGAFDITVAPLVNAWGFGFKNAAQVDSIMIDSLHQFVGIAEVELIDGKVVKIDPRLMLDCSAIAKGYGVDCVARLLDSKGIRNYMINIGGELVMKGENPKMETWSIGVNKPIDDSLSVNQEIQAVLKLTNVGLATSGNYRNFYYKGGKKYAHTIDPRTGYPIQHNILSATVVAPDCATADAYATSFMVLGLDSAKQICNAHPELDAYFIYTTDKGNTEIYYTTGMKQYLQQH